VCSAVIACAPAFERALASQHLFFVSVRFAHGHQPLLSLFPQLALDEIQYDKDNNPCNAIVVSSEQPRNRHEYGAGGDG
jgi:hypothetical protein